MTGRPGHSGGRRATAAGARVSRRLLRWPARNYFAELAPGPRETHPVDDLMEADPDLGRIRRRARRFLGQLEAGAARDVVLAFESERNHLEEVRVELAFNLGFESGVITGRAEGLRRSVGRRQARREAALTADLNRALNAHRIEPERTRAILQEIAWSFAAGAPGAAAAEANRRRT